MTVRDFGTGWSNTRQSFPRYRLSWDDDSGELFTHNCSTGDEEVLAVIRNRSTVDFLLGEWHEVIYQPNSLRVIERRLSEYADELSGVSQ